MGLLQINGIKINVEVIGKGLPVMLIHGIGGNMTQWKPTADRLSKDFKVIMMDCRGHGKSEKPKQYSLSDHASDIIGIMDHFEIESTYLNGISMGSYIAQAVAIQAPERISKLILTVPKSNGLTSSLHRLITEHSAELAGLDQHSVVLALLKYLTYDPKFMEQHLDIFDTDLNGPQFEAANRAVMGFDFRNDLAKVMAKTLVITGKYDQLNPTNEGEICASLIRDARLMEMQYSGHAPNYEEADAYLKIIRDFFNS